MNYVDSLSVDNFRSLYNFQMDLRSFSILIGRNDAGKTTIIRALQLLLNDNATQSVDAYDWSRVAKSTRFPRNIQLTGQIRTESGCVQIMRKITIHKHQPAQSALYIQRDGQWQCVSQEDTLQLPILYYLKPRTGALQESFDPQKENNIFSLVKEWMPPELSEERHLHKLMRGYAPKENNLMAYVNFFKERIYAPMKIAFPSNFPSLLLHPDFRTPTDRGRLFVRELRNPDEKEAIFRLPLDRHGTGLISVVAFVLSIEVLREHHRQNLNAKPIIFAIEEPEVHLHAQAQHTFLNYLRWLSQDHQTIVSTHSPLFVDRSEPLNVLVVRRSTLKDSKDTKHTWNIGTTRVFGNSYSDTWVQVRDALGIRLSDALMAGEFNLVVEGPTEEVLLPVMAKVWAIRNERMLDIDRVLIVSGSGSGNIPYITRVLLSTKNQTAVVVDGDTAGQSTMAQIRKDQLSVAFVYKLDCTILQPPLNTLPECEFEDFLDPQLLLNAFNQLHLNSPELKLQHIEFDEFQKERRRLMGLGKSFGWIATVESILARKTTDQVYKMQSALTKVPKKKLAEVVSDSILKNILPLPAFCDELFRQIEQCLQNYTD